MYRRKLIRNPDFSPVWVTDLRNFISSYAAKPRFGFRASCIDHWSYKYLDEGMRNADPERPSTVRRNMVLEEYGFVSKIIYIKSEKGSARVFCRGDGFSCDDLFVYIGKDWFPESYVEGLEGEREFLKLLSGRREEAEKAAKKARKAREEARKEALERALEEEKKNRSDLENAAADDIRAALYRSPRAWNKYGERTLKEKEKFEKKVSAALARWRRHYKLTGESMSGGEAILPKRHLFTRHQRKDRYIPQRVVPNPKPAPTYYFETTAPQEPPQIVSEPYQAPSVLSYGDEPSSDYYAPTVYQAPSVLSYGDEPQAPIPESSANDTTVESSREARIAEAQRILNDPRSSVADRLKANADFDRALFAPSGDPNSPHNMSLKKAQLGKRSLYEQDRQEGERILGINKTQPVSLAPWAIMLGDWLERAEREVWETQPLLTNGVKSTAAPMFCIPASSLRLAVDKHFGEKTVSPKKLGAFMRERGFGAGNKMWRQGAIRVFYKNCAGPADPQRMIVCNVNDDGRSVTWGMERGAVLAAQI